MRYATRLTGPLLAFVIIAAAPVALAAGGAPAPAGAEGGLSMDQPALKALAKELIEKHGADQAERVQRGLQQVVKRWRPGDGSVEDLAAFARQHFLSDPEQLKDTAAHIEYALEMLYGHANEVAREMQRYQMLDEGPLRPVDGLLAAFSPQAHIDEDLFASKIAFVALLNWPLTNLEERLQEGPGWTRERWALARLTGRFEHRLPAEVIQGIAQASSASDRYIDNYNIHVGQLVTSDGRKLFPKGKKLISHWGLRDEIRAQYARPDGLERQRLLAKVMDRIIRQELPAEVVDSDAVEWDPVANRVRRKPGGAWEEAKREPDTRYERILGTFHAQRAADPYFEPGSTHVKRIFEMQREIPEDRMRQLLEGIVGSPVAKDVAAIISKRLGRPLEPHDIWYTGFRAGGSVDEDALSAITRKRYPTVDSFAQDVPAILGKLGFDPETAAFLKAHIEVDPARGAGHAYPAELREGKSHLRTRVPKDGLDYKGFNIAMHELGHNVEQVFSMARVDHTLLSGVPNNGFTEAFAFVFQARDLEMLGQGKPNPDAEALRALDRFWDAYEIAGVALLDMDIWNWMYAHPDAAPAQLREAVVGMADTLWKRYYEPVLGEGAKGALLPAIYSHIVAYSLYTPDYPLGFLIAFQVEQHLKGRQLATEMERMCRQGRLAPDVWMQQAVGSPVSNEALLEAAAAAAERIGAR